MSPLTSRTASRTLNSVVVASLVGLPSTAVAADGTDLVQDNHQPVISIPETDEATAEDAPHATTEPSIEQQIEQASKERGAAEAEMNSLQQSAHARSDALETAKSDSNEATKALNTAQAEHTAADADLRAAHAQLQQDAKNAVTLLEEQMRDAEKVLADASAAREAAQTLVNAQAQKEDEAKALADAKRAEALNAADSDIEAAQRVATERDHALSVAEANKAQAADDLKSAEDAHAAAQANQSSAQSAADTARTQAEAASTALQEAEANVATKNRIYEDLKNGSPSPEALTQAQEAIRVAEEKLAKSQEAETAARNDLNSKQAELESLTTAKNNKASELSAAQERNAQADQALSIALDHVAQAQAELSNALKRKTEAEQNLAAQNDAGEPVKAALAEAQNDLEAARRLEQEKAAAVDTARQAVVKAESDLANVAERAAEGSFGFFKDRLENGESDAEKAAAQKALDVLNTSTASQGQVSRIVKGNPNGATSLENMKHAIEGVAKSNEYRARGGLNGATLPEFKITDYMMATAQWQTSWSENIISHSSAFNVGENLAWGYDTPAKAFEGWYDKEKEVYDDLVKRNVNIEEWKNQKDERGWPNVNRIGHYLNLVHPDYTVAGYAYSTKDAIYGKVAGQTFYFNSTDPVYTVDEYRARFMTYYNSVSPQGAQRKVNEAKARLTQAESELATARQNTAAKQQTVTEKEAALARARSAVTNAEASVTASQQNVEQKQTALEAATSEVTRRQADVTAAQQQVQALALALTSASEAVTNQDALVQAAQATLNAAGATVTADTEALAARRQDQANLLGDAALAPALEALNAAKATRDSAQTLKSEKDAAVTRTQSALLEAHAALRASQATLDAAGSKATKATQDVTHARTALTQARQALASLQAKKNAADTANAAYAQAQAAHQAAKDALAERTKELTTAQESLPVLTTRLEDAKARRTFVLSLTLNQVYADLDATAFPTLGTVRDRLDKAKSAVVEAQKRVSATQATLIAAQKSHDEAQLLVRAAKVTFDAADARYQDLLGKKALRDAQKKAELEAQKKAQQKSNTPVASKPVAAKAATTAPHLAATGATLDMTLAASATVLALYAVTVPAQRRRRDP